MIRLIMLYRVSAGVLVLIFVFWGIVTPVQARPGFPAPPDATVESVGENMKVNGIAMDIREFVSRRGPAAVLAFYRGEWPRGTPERPGFTETDALPPWRILTRVEDGYLMTVQVMDDPGGGSRGYLAISLLPDADREPEIGAGFPVMQGSSVYNDVVSSDPGKAGRTVSLTNTHTLAGNVAFYRQYYENHGWVKEMDQGVDRVAHVIRFRNGRETVDLSINNLSGKTYITGQVIRSGVFD